ncbi:uncharacterized protein ACLA_040760 [Aspergillus clavatus NRRL 1]|uniref:Uncharacterized protein n=1 Tax=Aspergillus clavatus (strain ATCC 1007 / CBS 513.65 / DSM 816 / NCTC 3887 / NRRL 1 / QM 1276 / 107) TaxID=344612 RepID=A1CL36_ASPCL|nr:uncharacterized protein ACLA_040760 [Aspergillus clavatus NRRL 1]EAW09860.1 conserved hypothetical protein [Aspergillus clavatus NRRL 1]
MPYYFTPDPNQLGNIMHYNNNAMQSSSYQQPSEAEDYTTEDEEEVVYELDERAMACLPERLREIMREIHRERLERVQRENPDFEYRRASSRQNDHAERWLENVVVRLMESQSAPRPVFHTMADALPIHGALSSYQPQAAVEPQHAYNNMVPDHEQFYPRVTVTELSHNRDNSENDIQVEHDSTPVQEEPTEIREPTEPMEDMHRPPPANRTRLGDKTPKKKPTDSKCRRRRSSMVLEMRSRLQKKVGKVSRFFKSIV